MVGRRLGDLVILERATPKRIVLTLLLALGLYGFMLPLWFAVDAGWARAVAAGASRVGFPLTGLDGSVKLKPAPSVQFEYFLQDPRSGAIARVPQRLLNLPDVPLAIALALSLLMLPWRRRIGLAVVLVAVIFAVHVVLLVVSAHRAASILARTDLPLEAVNEQLSSALNGMNRWGDVSVVVIVVLALLGVRLLREPPRGRVTPEPSTPGPAAAD